MSGEAAPKQRMRDAAAVLLIEEGPDAVTHRRVARAAGIPQGSANHWYPTKASLFRDAVISAEQLRNAKGRELVETLPIEPRSTEAIAALMMRVWYAPHVGPDVIPARLSPMLDAMRSAEHREIMARSREERLETLRLLLQRSEMNALTDIDLIAVVLDATLLYNGSTGEADPLDGATLMLARFLRMLCESDAPRADTAARVAGA